MMGKFTFFCVIFVALFTFSYGLCSFISTNYVPVTVKPIRWVLFITVSICPTTR